MAVPTVLLTGLLSAAVLVSGVETPPSAAAAPATVVGAAADEPVPVITSDDLPLGPTIVPGTTVYLNPSQQQVTMTVGQNPVSPQCLADIKSALEQSTVPDNVSICVGEALAKLAANGVGPGAQLPPKPVVPTVSNGSTGYFRPDIGWMEEEAVNALMLLHGTTDGDVIRSYGRGDIRAYLYSRLNSILNKRLYGVPLTKDESRTYLDLMTFLATREYTRAKNAEEEYYRWESDPCNYPIPARPSESLPFFPNTAAQPTRCDQAFRYQQLSQFNKATPPVEAFEAWGNYRNPTPMLRNLDSPAVKQMATGMDYGIANLVGMGSAPLAALGAASVVASSKPLAASIVRTISPYATKIAQRGPLKGIKLVTTAFKGASLTFGIIGAIIEVAIVTALAIWELVEEAKVPAALKQRVEQAAQNRDPLGIDALRPQYVGLDYDTLEQPSDDAPVPFFMQTDVQEQLKSIVSEWTMFDGAGNIVRDPESGYDDVEPTATDVRFRVVGQPLPTAKAAALANDETPTGQPIISKLVHFSRGNLMVAPSVGAGWGTAKPATSVRFERQNGRSALMSIAYTDPDGDGPGTPERKFLITELGEGRAEPFLAETWDVVGFGGVDTSYELVEDYAVIDPPMSVVPTLFGALLPKRQVKLQAHTSANTPTGVTYNWTIDRLGPTGDVVSSESLTNVIVFKSFDQPGDYRATVRVRNGSTELSAGVIEFTVGVPQPEVVQADLVDSRTQTEGKLFLDLELGQATPGDSFDVEVEWADDNRGHRVVRSYDVTCAQADLEACFTGPLSASVPTNANWSEPPVYQVPEDQSFLPFVTVRVTNSYGGTVEQTFRIAGEHRAVYADRTPYVRMEVGRQSTVPVTTIKPSPNLPNASITVDEFVDEITAQLPAGLTPGVEGPDADGAYTLLITGKPETADIGPVSFFYPVDQLSSGISVPESRPAPAQVTLAIVSSVAPGFRAILSNVPSGGSFVVAREVEPEWNVQVPYETPPGADPADDPPYTGQTACDLKAGGQQVAGFPKLCAVDEPFPWPTGLDGVYEASVQAVPSTVPPPPGVDYTPYTKSVTFQLLEPTLTRSAGSGATDTLTLALRDRKYADNPITGVIPAPFSASGYTVTCAFDGGANVPCLDSGAQTVLRTAGEHRVVVRVKAPDDATVERELTWTVGTPPVALSVGGPAGIQLVGAPVRVTASGLLPRERYRVLVDGTEVATGTATDEGGVSTQVTLPATLADGAHTLVVVGATPQRTGQAGLVAAGPATLGVKVKKKVAAGAKQKLRVSGLVAGEQVTVRWRGKQVGTAVAGADGTAVLRFKVGGKTGKGSVVVTGAFASRSGKATFRVTERKR